MSRSHVCSRQYSRDGLNRTIWGDFFKASNNTPFVFLESDSMESTINMDGIVAYISNVEYNEFGFSYTLNHISEEIDEDKFLEEYGIEIITREVRIAKKITSVEILAVVMVKKTY